MAVLEFLQWPFYHKIGWHHGDLGDANPERFTAVWSDVDISKLKSACDQTGNCYDSEEE